jgi:hypothetical protein
VNVSKNVVYQGNYPVASLLRRLSATALYRDNVGSPDLGTVLKVKLANPVRPSQLRVSLVGVGHPRHVRADLIVVSEMVIYYFYYDEALIGENQRLVVEVVGSDDATVLATEAKIF